MRYKITVSRNKKGYPQTNQTDIVDDFYKSYVADKKIKKEFDKYLLNKFHNKEIVNCLKKDLTALEFLNYWKERGIFITKDIIAIQLGVEQKKIENKSPREILGYFTGYADGKKLNNSLLNKLSADLQQRKNLRVSDPGEQKLFDLVYNEIKKNKFAKPNYYLIFKHFNDKDKLVDPQLIFEKKFTNSIISPLYNRYNQFRIRKNKK
jgi:hypothetical protein